MTNKHYAIQKEFSIGAGAILAQDSSKVSKLKEQPFMKACESKQPIDEKLPELLDLVNNNKIVICVGETGSGKQL